MSETEDFGSGERDYLRLTTVGRIEAVLGAMSGIGWNLEMLGMEGEAAALAHAYEALTSAVERLRPEPE